MNSENLEKLRDWLKAGAPSASFDMNTGVVVQGNEAGLGTCGTVCCIAGAAYQMSLTDHGGFPTPEETFARFRDKFYFELPWPNVRNGALEWLGLPKQGYHSGHELFSQYAAPTDCTPADAATAVQNMLDHGDPRWNEIRISLGQEPYEEYDE